MVYVRNEWIDGRPHGFRPMARYYITYKRVFKKDERIVEYSIYVESPFLLFLLDWIDQRVRKCGVMSHWVGGYSWYPERENMRTPFLGNRYVLDQAKQVKFIYLLPIFHPNHFLFFSFLFLSFQIMNHKPEIEGNRDRIMLIPRIPHETAPQSKHYHYHHFIIVKLSLQYMECPIKKRKYFFLSSKFISLISC